jgi:RNA polymerase sigma-70 factor, ECF subfamily
MSEYFASREGRTSSWGAPGAPASATQAAHTVLSADTRLAIRVRALFQHGQADAARTLFASLVDMHQRRALAVAYQYLRDRSDAEDAVQDAFIRAYSHIGAYRDAWPFGVWFTRILVNGCIDRHKARVRRGRWLAPATSAAEIEGARPAFGGERVADPETVALARERWVRLAGAVRRLGGRQRTVFLLCHYADWTPREVGAMLGLNESTVRVHLFRAAHKLRSLLGRP